MSEMIRLSNGNDVSQETVDAAMEEYTLRHPEKYIFQAGDVVEKPDCGKRLIIDVDGKLRSVYANDGFVISIENVDGQKDFEICKYRKIGVLSEYIK